MFYLTKWFEELQVKAKKNLAKLTYVSLFLGALKSNAMSQNVNRKEVEMALGKWFTGARDRGGERAARAERKKRASTTQTTWVYFDVFFWELKYKYNFHLFMLWNLRGDV